MKENQKIRQQVLDRFLAYCQVNTRSNHEVDEIPSSKGQFELAELIKKEMEAMGLSDVELDDHSYLYGCLKASDGVEAPVITLCAHLDTSPDASGENVKPIIRKYEGKALSFPDDNEMTLSETDCHVLKDFWGEEIITASGLTLLGADDKAGIAEIMTTMEILCANPDIKHPEIRLVFTPDEETGRGTSYIKREKLGDFAYTMDGGRMGELEDECFNAWSVKIDFTGVNVHPGESKNRMINAIAIAARFVAALPEWESPEHTEKREGFYHVGEMSGDESYAKLDMIIRDFEEKNNLFRIEYLKSLADSFEKKYKGLKITVKSKESYRNMYEILKEYPKTTEIAEKAIEMAGIQVIKTAIRGGTDGARLSFMGLPTPNIFTGGLLFHSKKEWIPVIALEKAVETLLNILTLWSAEKK
ncbi:MAG TPA: peptidase T [Candidatus Cloacimonadota bacterium]|nr:peptidase T [Candidatus Cloacimonadota bacterium]